MNEQRTGETPSNPARAFSIAGWVVDPPIGRISRGDETAQLEPKVMEVLEYLARRPGQVVGREELEAAVWLGRVVGYDAVTNAIIKLRKAFKDDPRHPRIIETLSKRGYRLVAPVGQPEERTETNETAGHDLARAQTRNRWIRAGAATALAVLVAAVGALFWQSPWKAAVGTGGDRAPLQSIAVLPFDNLSGDRNQDYFADGVTDDLITGLA
ncbi:MAG: winged helix-turn-helix domain-containing protein, partial [Pseudomonadota bacterium]